jgi:prepilin-type N-terminal cleavage/methylation domain-containing protein
MRYLKFRNKENSRANGYSLVEIVVSLAIVGVVLSMLSNVLINSIIISQKSLSRSFVREELAQISNQMYLIYAMQVRL